MLKIRKKTSRARGKAVNRRLHLKVNSPRIFGFSCLKTTGRVLKLGVLLAVVGGAVWGTRQGLHQVFIKNEEFELKVVDLQTGGTMDVESFMRVAELTPGVSVFAVNLREVQERLESRPAILKVDLKRRLPGTLRVEVRERVPLAWLECRGQGIEAKNLETGLLLDKEGVAFPCEAWWAGAAADLPVVVVDEAKEGDFVTGKPIRHREAERALHLVTLGRRILASESWTLPVVAVRNGFSLIAATSEGAVVTFGMYGHERQLADLKALHRHARETERGIERVNLIPERNIPVVYLPGTGEVAPPEELPLQENRLELDIKAILNRS